jgi:PIN domain nuclease of toxin-antitoxin system
MRLLLDTHTALWWVNEYEKLSLPVRNMLLEDANELYISIASIWEMAIKVSVGKLCGLSGGVRIFNATLKRMPVSILPIRQRHIEIVETLPFIHRDPFDRLLIAAAKAEDMAIVTVDENIHQYDVRYIW